MGILSIEPHKELDLDQMMLNVGFNRYRDWDDFDGHIIVYRWIHADAYGLSITCKFYCSKGHNLLRYVMVHAEPDFLARWENTVKLRLEGQDALDKIREYVLKQTDGIIDIFREL